MKTSIRDKILKIILDTAEPNTEGNILAPPMNAQKAIDLLAEFFLGDNRIVSYPCGNLQINSCALAIRAAVSISSSENVCSPKLMLFFTLSLNKIVSCVTMAMCFLTS